MQAKLGEEDVLFREDEQNPDRPGFATLILKSLEENRYVFSVDGDGLWQITASNNLGTQTITGCAFEADDGFSSYCIYMSDCEVSLFKWEDDRSRTTLVQYVGDVMPADTESSRLSATMHLAKWGYGDNITSPDVRAGQVTDVPFVVPEPSTAVMSFVCLACLFIRRRR